MSTHEDGSQLFNFWEKDILLKASVGEPTESAVDNEQFRVEIEHSLLGLDIEEIKQKLGSLGIEEFASMHTIPSHDGFFSVYITRIMPEGKHAPQSCVRVVTNEVVQTGTERAAIIEDYYVDIADYGVEVYRSTLTGDVEDFTIPNDTPPFIERNGVGVSLTAGDSYDPRLPSSINHQTSFEVLNRYRQEMVILLHSLDRLSDVSEDLKIPYAS